MRYTLYGARRGIGSGPKQDDVVMFCLETRQTHAIDKKPGNRGLNASFAGLLFSYVLGPPLSRGHHSRHNDFGPVRRNRAEAVRL